MKSATGKIFPLLLCAALLLQLLPCGSLASTAKADEAEQLQTTLYSQDFEGYSQPVMLEGEKTVEGWHVFGNAAGTISGGTMTLTGTENGHVQLDIPGASEWSNYTVEVDMTYLNATSSWVGVAYNSVDDTCHQKAGIFNTMGYFINGRYNSSWVNNDTAINNTTDSRLTVAVNKPFRLKVESFAQNGYEEGGARLSVAYYENGKLGDWIVLPEVNNIDPRLSKGSIGFAMPSAGNAKVTVDNIHVYKNADVLYREDFSAYDGDTAVTVTAGRTKADWKMDAGPGRVELDDGRMNVYGQSGNYSHVFLDLEEAYQWRNYVLEADIQYNAANWVGLAYNAQSFRLHQKGGVYGGNSFFLNGRDDLTTGNNPGWVNDVKEGKNPNHAASSAVRITLGKPMRLRIETSGMTGKQEGTATLSIAWYDEAGNLGPWTHISTVQNIHPNTWQGTIGVILANSETDAWVDNILVYKYHGIDPYEPPPANVSEIYIPESGIVNPPVVAQRVTDALPAAEGQRPAVAVMEVDEQGNILTASGEVLTDLTGWFETYRYRVIPAFVVGNETEAEHTALWLKEHGFRDAYILAEEENMALVTAALELHHDLRGGIFVDSVGQTEQQWAALCAKINQDAHVTQVISRAPIGVDTMTYFNNHAVALWGMADTSAEVYRAISSGYHGVVTESADSVYRIYKSIQKPTVSGRPIPIAHRGAHLQQGTLPDARGENTVDAFLLAIEKYGCLGVETDLKFTADGEIILHHDPEMTRITDIEERPEEYTKGYLPYSYTVEELKALNIDYMEYLTDDNWTGKLATFLEALEATEHLGLVYYCHISDYRNLARFNEILNEHPEYVDNCVIFVDSNSVNYSHNYKVLDAPLPITFAHNDNIDAMLAQENDLEVLEDMIQLMNRHNGHPLFYHYNGHATEDFYYEVAARGYVTIHSITNGQTNLNDRLLLEQGAVSLLTDTPWMCDDYHYYVDAPAQMELKAGQPLDLTHDIPMVLGALEQQECTFIQLSGPTIYWDDALDHYTAAEAGQAQIVFCFERTAEGGAEYQVYSQPVTVNITADPAAVKLNESVLTLEVGQVQQLFATILPISANDQTVIWSSEGEAAQVDEVGVITAMKPGEATITVTTKVGGVQASCLVTVLPLSEQTLAVMGQIETLAPVGIESGAALRAARAAYEALSSLRKAQVENYPLLLEAERAYVELLEQNQNADPVIKEKNLALTHLQKRYEQLLAEAFGIAKQKLDEAKAEAETAIHTADTVEQVQAAAVAGEKAMEQALQQKEPAKNPFKDVKKGDYFYESVLWAVENKVTAGVTPTQFGPDQNCTRAQVVTFLWRAKGEPEPTTTENPFTDVKEGEYYYKAVLWAVENEITAGLTPTTFGPEVSCTRAQVVSFLYRTEGKPAVTKTEHPFKDIKKGEYYYEAVLWAVENEVTAGTTPTTFAPNATCTRAQIVSFLYRALAE